MIFVHDTPTNRLLNMVLGGGSPVAEYTATGNPLTFITNVAKPLKSLLIPFTPQQEGTGDPSPQNVRPIVPWNGLKVYHSGADTSNPTETDISFPSPVYGGTLDVVSGVLTVECGAVRADSFEWETYGSNPYGQGYRTLGTFEVPFAGWQSDDSYLLAKSNALKPAPYDGTFDGSPLNSFWWNNYRTGFRCIYAQSATVQDLMNFFTENNVIFCGKLAEPQEITLTPEQITALKGDNTIWSDADGSMTAVYLKKD